MICDTSRETNKKSELPSQQMVNSLRVRSTCISGLIPCMWSNRHDSKSVNRSGL